MSQRSYSWINGSLKSSYCVDETVNSSLGTSNSRPENYIPSTLVAFLHNADVLVKTFSLFFTVVTKVLRRITVMGMKKMNVIDMRAVF